MSVGSVGLLSSSGFSASACAALKASSSRFSLSAALSNNLAPAHAALAPATAPAPLANVFAPACPDFSACPIS